MILSWFVNCERLVDWGNTKVRIYATDDHQIPILPKYDTRQKVNEWLESHDNWHTMMQTGIVLLKNCDPLIRLYTTSEWVPFLYLPHFLTITVNWERGVWSLSGEQSRLLREKAALQIVKWANSSLSWIRLFVQDQPIDRIVPFGRGNEFPLISRTVISNFKWARQVFQER